LRSRSASRARTRVAIASLVAGLGSTASGQALAAGREVVALVVGVNAGLGEGTLPLRYADDDALQYAALLGRLGAEVELLTRADAETGRLSPRNAGRPPTRAAVEAAEERLRAKVAAARARGRATVLYVVYAGHGDVEGSTGYVSLEDGRWTGPEIAAFIRAVGADTSHLVVDACRAYYLAHARGPGGQKRPAFGFSRADRLPGLAGVGLILSTSGAEESHEWDGAQAGVASYEIRSGLYGAADADGDGKVTYQELAAFVQRANEAIPNERFRPHVFFSPPAGTAVLAELGPGLDRRLDVAGEYASHYLLEDELGVRVAEFNSSVGQAVRLFLPDRGGLYFLRRLADDGELPIRPEDPAAFSLAGRIFARARSQARGAAHQALARLFLLPFDAGVVARLGEPWRIELALGERDPGPRWTEAARAGAFGASAAALAAAGITALVAANQRAGLTDQTSQLEASRLAGRLESEQRLTFALYGVAAAALTAGVVFLVWPGGEEEEP
jgi:hypothetical protein